MTLSFVFFLAFPLGFLCKSKPARFLLFSGGWALALLVSGLGLSLILAGLAHPQGCNGSFPDVWGCPQEVQYSLSFRLSVGLFKYALMLVLAFSFLYPFLVLMAGIIELGSRSDPLDGD